MKTLAGRAIPGAALALLALMLGTALGGTLTVQTNRLGTTPDILAYVSGHFYPGSNTRDWWQYAGVTGARMFLAGIEATDDIVGWGDGVVTQSDFLARRAALRADPLNTSYINWPYFSNRYENVTMPGVNKARVNFACSELRQLGIEIMVVINASLNAFSITNDSDWAGKWELWQHYYAQSFYLSSHFDVRKYQMFNEPNHANADGLTQAQYLQRLQLASDAIQCALADVNARYGKSLVPVVSAPVTSGTADGSYPGWGDLVVTNRHQNFLGQTAANYWVAHQYSYQQYDTSPTAFGGDLAGLHNLLTAAMAPEARFPTAITEFNVHTSSTWNTLPETVDSPSKYSRLGAIAVNLIKNGCSELYCYKLSQTGTKLGLHYVDNTSAPYNIGGISRAGELWRLVNKGFGPGRDRLNVVAGAGATNLDVLASYDPARQRYYLLSVNNAAGSVSVDLDLSGWNIPPGNRFLLEEVSETCYGAGRSWSTLGAARTLSLLQGSNSLWLLTLPAAPQRPEQVLAATADAEVRDGLSRGFNFGALTTLTARNDPTNSSKRSAGFIKFNLAGINPADIQLAVLSLQAATTSTNAIAQAHVYGLDNNNWSQSTLAWYNAPNLKDYVPAGSQITNNVVADAGYSAHMLGQLVVSSTNTSERFLDVTGFLRGLTNSEASFLVAQEVRWNPDPAATPDPDLQPDGVRILTLESGNGPRLRLVLTNRPPLAVEDLANATQAVPLAINVLTNDTDPNGDALVLQSFTQPAKGTVTAGADGTLTYTSNAGFLGLDRFSYTVSDGQGGTATATVYVTVEPATGPAVTVWTNLPALAEANVRGGAYAAVNLDERLLDLLMVKYNSPDLGYAYKAYWQFDLSGLNVNVNTQATLVLRTYTSSFRQRVQLWGLRQAYPAFNANVTWNIAQANDTTSNNLLTNGLFTAATIGPSVLVPGDGDTNLTFTVPCLRDYLLGDRLTLALSGVSDPTNHGGGLRLALNRAQLTVPVLQAPVLTNYIASVVNHPGEGVTLTFQGNPGCTYRVETSTNLAAQSWMPLSTNVADSNGFWQFTDPQPNPGPLRFYRSVFP